MEHLWMVSIAWGLTRGQPITRLFIEVYEKSWKVADKSSTCARK